MTLKRKYLNKTHNIDARKLDEILKDPIVDVTITSPPYFDLKDYGSKNQIGFGQTYADYLDDLKKVFEKVYKCTKDSGTLWVVIDTYRRNGEVVPLPFDFSNKIKEIGWQLQEILIWGKDKTLPWAHKGRMRNIFEYILLFSKSNKYKFNIDKIRDYESLKKWWIQFPERYNPKGKAPGAIWNYSIPVQGSWGNGYIKHFCPLPEEMIGQIIKLTTNESDVVLDPFAGSGAVLSKADNMKRCYIGFELNKNYIKMFNKYLLKTGATKRKEYEIENKGLIKQKKFQNLIIDLRALKYARIFYNKLVEFGFEQIKKIFVNRLQIRPQKGNMIALVKYNILLSKTNNLNKLKLMLNEIIAKSPLSNFGIEPELNFYTNIDDFTKSMNKNNLYVYTNKLTHKFKKKYEYNDLFENNKSDIIISKIKVNIDEKDYEYKKKGEEKKS